MNDLPRPPFPLWSRVGYENAVWNVVGLIFRPAYNCYGWEYFLCQCGDSKPDENSKRIGPIRDDQIITLEALLADRIEKSGKYAAETQRIAKEADAEHQRLMAQGMPR